MAIRGTFIADTRQFDAALEDMRKDLKAVEVSAKGAQAQFDRMFKGFQGEKVFRDAKLVAAAVTEIGGAARLTDAEQRKALHTIDEAIAKYRALGQAAPAELEKIQAELRQTVDATDKLKNTTVEATKQTGAWGGAFGTLKAAAAGFVAGFTLERVISGLGRAIGQTLEYASSINDLSARTSVSTTALQRWKYAAEQNGNTLDELVTAADQLAKRLGEGDKSTVAALNKLGLSAERLKGQSMERTFEEVGAALAGVTNNYEQAALAQDLLGKSGMAVFPTLKADIAALGDEAERLGVVLSEDTIKAMDDFGDTIDKVQAAGQGLLARFIAPAIPALNFLADAMANAAAQGDRFRAFMANFAAANPLLTMITSLNQATAAWELYRRVTAQPLKAPPAMTMMSSHGGAPVKPTEGAPGTAKFTTEMRAAATAAAALQKELDKLTGADKVASAQKLAENIEKVGLVRVDPAQWKAIATAMQDAIDSGNRLGIVIPQGIRDILAALRPVVPAFEAWKHVIEDIEVRARKLVGTWKDGFAALPGIIRPATDAIEDARNGTKDADDAAKQWSKTLDTLGTAFAELAQSSNEGLAGFAAAAGRIISSLKLVDKGLEAIARGGLANIVAGILSIVAAFDQATSSANRFQNALGGFMVGFQAGSIFGPIGSLIGGGIGFLGGLFRSTSSQANQLREQLFSAAGGVQALREQFERANLGQHWNEFLRATNPRDVQRWFDQVQANIAFLEERLSNLSDSLQKTVQHNLALTREQFHEMAALAGEPAADEAIFQFMQAQAGNANSAILAIATNLTLTEKSAAGAAAALGATFAELRRQGMSTREAFETVRPAMEAVRAQLERLGIGGGEAFDVINAQWHLFAREGVPEVMDGIAGIADAITSMHNLRLLTPEMFEQLASGLVDARQQLLDLGLTHEQTLAAMAPDIQRIWELMQDFGYKVDDATEALIKEAKAAGLVGDEFRSSESQMAQAIKRLVDSINALIVTLGGDLPDAARDAADGIQGHLDRIRVPQIRVPIEWDDLPELPTDWRPRSETGDAGLPTFATGSGGLRDFGSGTLAMLHGREAVLTEAQIRRLTAGSGGSTVHVTLTVHAIDAKGVKDFVESPDFGRSFTQSIRQNVQGRRSDTRAALGVT